MKEVFVVMEEYWYSMHGTSREIVDIYDTKEQADERASELNDTNGHDTSSSSQSYCVDTHTVKTKVVSITKEMVERLRNETGEGIMCCNKALKHCNGDMDKAKDYLRSMGTLCV